MKEIWKDVLHYEGYYQVSNFGRVRAVERMLNHAVKAQKDMLMGI